MSNSYITLTSDETPTPSLGGKYVVVMMDPGLVFGMQKSESEERTIGGGLDIGQGGVYDLFTYMIRAPVTPETGYGTYLHIRNMYRLTSPYGTPSRVLKLTDHLGANHSVVTKGDYRDSPMTFQLDGGHAWYLMTLTLRKLF